ncbi:MAG: lactate racemase domain-containing protein [Planctomycetaceae bacterium]
MTSGDATNNSSPLPTLTENEVREWVSANLPVEDFRGKSVLLIVPDATRTAPLPLLFDCISKQLGNEVTSLDVLVALGTHPPMPKETIAKMMGIDGRTDFPGPTPKLFNHEWDNPAALTNIGTLTREDTESISNGLLSEEVPVEVNSKVLDYDIAMVVGPVFPHEVVGFSGGNKYFFPGVSGPELLNFFHWLGALISNVGIIGIKDTPVRRVVNRAGAMVGVEKRCLAFVVSPTAELYGMFYGTPESAWDGAAELSGKVHIKRKPKPFKQVLSCAPLMYDELWVAGKCMYKLEPVVADGGELIIYAPHLDEISITHGENIRAIGYHVRDYFTKQWDKFKDRPWGVLAHSTHVRGTGTFEEGVEKPRIKVTLASQIPEDVCKEINLGYRDPATIDVESFADREDEGVLLVRKAGEHLYRLEGE